MEILNQTFGKAFSLVKYKQAFFFKVNTCFLTCWSIEFCLRKVEKEDLTSSGKSDLAT